MDLFSRGVCGAGVRVSSDDDGGCCRTVVEDSEKRSRRRAFLRSSMLSRSSSSSSRVRLLRSSACNALVLSCARSCCSLASRDCSNRFGCCSCGCCGVCCWYRCKCSCRLNRCRCWSIRAAGMLSRNAVVICWTCQSRSNWTSSASSSAMLGIIDGSDDDVAVVFVGTEESWWSSRSRDRRDPLVDAAFTSFDADSCDVLSCSMGVSDDDGVDSDGACGACTLSSCSCGIVSVDLFFFIGIDGGGIWILSTQSLHNA